MGGANSQLPQEYSVPLPGTKTPGFTQIYRSSKAINQLSDTPHQQLKSMKDVVIRSCKHQFPYNNFIGQVIIKGSGQNEERELVKFTYGQAFQMAEHLGSSIMSQKLFYPQKQQNMKLIGIFSKNRYEWIVADIACMLYGLTIVPLYDTLGTQNLTYCLQNSEMTSCFATSGTIQTLLKLKGHGNLKNVISFDNLNSETEQKLKTQGFNLSYFSDMIKKPNQFIDHQQIKVSPENCLTFSYTSGTTGPPKGAMLSHKNFLSFIAAFKKSDIQQFRQDDVYLSFLPLPHVFQRVTQAGILYFGAFSVFFNGDVTKLKDDCLFIKPTIFIGVPRIFNRIKQVTQQRIQEAGGVKACLFNAGFKSKKNQLQESGEFTSGFYDKIVFSKTKESFGGNIRFMITGSAPIRKEVFEFMKIIMCCPFYEGYGQTENTAAAFITSTYDSATGHVGGVTANLEFKLADLPEMQYTSADIDEKGNPTPRGEIWLRGPAVFMGYYKQPDKTQQALTEDGWLRTGDVGMLLPNTKGLKIIDRKKNIFKLQQGEYVASEKVQAIYSKSALVSEVFLHGESTHNYAVAIISLNKDELLKVGNAHQSSKNYEELCLDKTIRKYVCQQLNALGKKEGLKGFEQAKNVYLESKNFQDQGILTNTLKLQRFAAKKKYMKEIQAMYEEGPLN